MQTDICKQPHLYEYICVLCTECVKIHEYFFTLLSIIAIRSAKVPLVQRNYSDVKIVQGIHFSTVYTVKKWPAGADTQPLVLWSIYR